MLNHQKENELEKERAPFRFNELFWGGVLTGEGVGVRIRSPQLDALLDKPQEA